MNGIAYHARLEDGLHELLAEIALRAKRLDLARDECLISQLNQYVEPHSNPKTKLNTSAEIIP